MPSAINRPQPAPSWLYPADPHLEKVSNAAGLLKATWRTGGRYKAKARDYLARSVHQYETQQNGELPRSEAIATAAFVAGLPTEDIHLLLEEASSPPPSADTKS